jgi:hypothetical protein
VPRDRAKAAGEDQQRRPPLEKQLGAARRDALVVTAEDQNRVRLRQLMIEAMVIPDFPGEGPYSIVHPVARPRNTTKDTKGTKKKNIKSLLSCPS